MSAVEEYPVLAYVPDVPFSEVEDIVMGHWGIEEDDTPRGRLSAELRADDAALAAFAAQLAIVADSDDMADLEEAFVEMNRDLSDHEVQQLQQQSTREISLYLQARIRGA